VGLPLLRQLHTTPPDHTRERKRLKHAPSAPAKSKCEAACLNTTMLNVRLLACNTTMLLLHRLHRANATQPNISGHGNPNPDQTSRPSPSVLDTCPTLKEPACPDNPVRLIAMNITLGCSCMS